jgi:hypothetical protein
MPRRNLHYIATPPAELDRLSEVSASDIERADARWHVVAPQKLAGLADAVEAEPHARP